MSHGPLCLNETGEFLVRLQLQKQGLAWWGLGVMGWNAINFFSTFYISWRICVIIQIASNKQVNPLHRVNLTFSMDGISNFFSSNNQLTVENHIFMLIFATLTLTLSTVFNGLLKEIYHSLIPPVILLFTWCCQPSYTFTMEPCQLFEAMLLYTQDSSHINE